MYHEHTNVISWFTEQWCCSLFSFNIYWGPFYCWHFLSIYYLLLAIYYPSSLPQHLICYGQISFPFLNLIKHKDFWFYNASNCGLFSLFKSRKRDMEDLQFSMGRQYGHPSCLYRRQNVVLTNPQMHLSFFFLFLWILLTSYCFFCMKIQLCGWQSAHCLSVFEQLACPGPVPDAVRFFFFFFACLSLH